MEAPEDIYFFTSAEEMQHWLSKNHAKEKELWVGYHHKKTGKLSLTWQQSVEAALCYGWIDGIRKSAGEGKYTIRFTPRKKGSTWSNVNIALAEKLLKQKRMRAAGKMAFGQRKEYNTGIYSYEKDAGKLNTDFQKEFMENAKAWNYFINKPPGYQKTCIHWVMSAKQEETRRKRFKILLDSSENLTNIPLLRPSKK